MHRRTLLGGASALVLAGLAACSSDNQAAGPQTGGIANKIKVTGVLDLTGPVAYAGVGAGRGAQLAAEEIARQKFLGDGVTLELVQVDSAGEIERASSEVTKALADRETMAILGPVQGQQAAAVAPLAARQKCPIWFTQAGAEGVVVSDWTFRATAPMHTYYPLALDYLAEQNLKSVAVLYNATYPTLAELATKTVPPAAQRAGLTITSSTPVQSSTQDFATVTQQIAAQRPDAVLLLILNTQAITAINQFQQAGYQGKYMGNTNLAGGNLRDAGPSGRGVLYPVDFSAGQTDETAKKFTETYESRFGAKPPAYAAEGYDGMWWLARGIKASGDSSREGIQRGMAQVAGEGFTGAMGALRFEGNDMRVPGVVAEWDGAKETVVKTGAA